jgi:hypothetical protein
MFAEIDLFGSGPPRVPWEATGVPTTRVILEAISKASPLLPRAYREAYVEKLVAEIPSLLAREDRLISLDVLEAITGAVYDHDPESGVNTELHRLLAIISELYTSFLSERKRQKIEIPLAAQLPPLAVFQSHGRRGPFTLSSDVMTRLIGSQVGVVSLPSTYRAHPVLWGALAHETGGHDVSHSDKRLLPELAARVAELFGGSVRGTASPTSSQLKALVWSYWIDQASADIYGVLNMGPAFGSNLAALFAALNHRAIPDKPLPWLRNESGTTAIGTLDHHPTDILRPHLLIGLVEKLDHLDPSARARYVGDLAEIAEACAQGATEITLHGGVPIDASTTLLLDATFPLAEWQDAARNVGELVAEAKLQSLGGHSIQDLKTWDDADEAMALRVRDALEKDQSVAHVGNNAQLLAGATLALIDDPDLYQTVTSRLNEALDESFNADPHWGAALIDPMYVPSVGALPISSTGVGAISVKAACRA